MSDNPDYKSYDYAGDAMRWLAAGFGMGLLVGGALGILLAPKPGRETREQLRGFATDFGERAKVIAGDFGDRAKTAATGIHEQATTTYSSVRGTASGAAEDFSKTAKTVSGTITEGIATLKEAGVKFQQAVKDGYVKKMEELGDSPEGDTIEEIAEGTVESEDETPRKRTRKKKEDTEGETVEE